mgnify:CR=1 FL=1
MEDSAIPSQGRDLLDSVRVAVSTGRLLEFSKIVLWGDS